MFADADEFKRVLSDELKIDDDNLIAALGDNTDAVYKWVQ
jgi:hypothetical protein